MTTYRDWSITASANTGNAADGYFKENMKYQDVNDAARAMQAILARDRLDKSGTIRTTGTSASYELSVNANLPSLADGDHFRFDAHVKNAGAAELQIKADGTATFSSMAIVNTDLSALRDGQLRAGGVYDVVFRSASASSRQFQLLNPSLPSVIRSDEIHVESSYSDTDQLIGTATGTTALDVVVSASASSIYNMEINVFFDSSASFGGSLAAWPKGWVVGPPNSLMSQAESNLDFQAVTATAQMTTGTRTQSFALIRKLLTKDAGPVKFNVDPSGGEGGNVTILNQMIRIERHAKH